MDNSSVNVAAGFVWVFQYVTKEESWLRVGLPQFFRCKFHKHSVACGKDVDCWQAPFLKMAMVKVREDMTSDCYLIFFI